MAFMDKLGQIANKVGDVAGDTLDYGKAKGKVVLERGKIKDDKEALGEYVYLTIKAGGTPDLERMKKYCEGIDAHMAEIEKLEADAKQSEKIISEAFREGKE